jgi:hypothetical protein
MAVKTVRCSLLVMAVIGVLAVTDGRPSRSSATLSEPAATRSADGMGVNLADSVSGACQPLCYGISDDSFADVRQAYDRGVRLFRKITPFDISMRMSEDKNISPTSTRCNKPSDWQDNFRNGMRAWYESFLDSAGKVRDDVELMVSFERDWCMSKTMNRDVSNQKYADAIAAFVTEFPGIKKFTAWNEPNHADQGYHGKRYARKAGERFKAVYDHCNPAGQPARCEVIPGDFAQPLPSRDWLANYRIATQLDGRIPQKWALHPYTSVRNRSGKGIREFLTRVGAVSELWFTEAGAFHHWRNRRNGPDFPANRRRQYKDLRYLLGRLATKSFDPRVTRLYYYEWADDNEDFGTGLVRRGSRLDTEQKYMSAVMTRGHPVCLWHYRAIDRPERARRCNR